MRSEALRASIQRTPFSILWFGPTTCARACLAERVPVLSAADVKRDHTERARRGGRGSLWSAFGLPTPVPKHTQNTPKFRDQSVTNSHTSALHALTRPLGSIWQRLGLYPVSFSESPVHEALVVQHPARRRRGARVALAGLGSCRCRVTCALIPRHMSHCPSGRVFSRIRAHGHTGPRIFFTRAHTRHNCQLQFTSGQAHSSTLNAHPTVPLLHPCPTRKSRLLPPHHAPLCAARATRPTRGARPPIARPLQRPLLPPPPPPTTAPRPSTTGSEAGGRGVQPAPAAQFMRPQQLGAPQWHSILSPPRANW